MALRHSCPNAAADGTSVLCRPNQPGKGPKRCPGCGATPEVEEGVYGIFRFDITGRRYGPHDYAPGTRRYQRSAAASAEARAVDPYHRGYVVRFIRQRLL